MPVSFGGLNLTKRNIEMTEQNKPATMAKSEKYKEIAQQLRANFKPENIVKVEEKEIVYENKVKILESIEYKNGTVKRRCVEIVKAKNKRKSTPRTKASIIEAAKKKKKG